MTAAKTGLWQPEEDALLAKWQAKVGNRWATIAKHIPGRTGQQCAQRWRHKVNPGIVHKPWTPEEDDLLASLVESEGQHWAAIARHLPGRTDQQCLGRWRRRIDPAICRGEWSAEEDALLLELHAQLGNAWSQIARRIAARTSQQCRGRYFQLEIKNGGAGPKSSGTRGRRVSRDSDDEYEDTDDDDMATPQPATDSSDYMPATHVKPFKMKVYSSSSLKKTVVPSPMPDGTPSSYSQGRKSTINKHVVRRLVATEPVSGTTASERSDHTLVAQPMVVPVAVAMTPSNQACYAAMPMQALPTAGNVPGPYMLPGVLWHMTATDMTVKQTALRSINRPPTSTKRAAIRHARCSLFKSIGCRSDSSPNEEHEDLSEADVTAEQEVPQTVIQPSAAAMSAQHQQGGVSSVGTSNMPAPAAVPLHGRVPAMNTFTTTIVPALFAPLPTNHDLEDLKSPSTPKHNMNFSKGTSALMANALDGTKQAAGGLDGVDNSLPAWSCLEPPSIARSEIATPDSIVKMLKSPPGLRDLNHMASLPGLLFSPGCSKPHFPVHAADVAIHHPTPSAYKACGAPLQTLPAHAAVECTPANVGISSPKNGMGQPRSLHAEAVAAGLMSPQATCISNWSAVPAVSWTSFQAARNELRELQQQFGSNAPGSAGPTPISNHTRSVLNEVVEDDDKDNTEYTGKHSVAGPQLGTMPNNSSVVCMSPRSSNAPLQEGLGSVKAPRSCDRLTRPALNEMQHSSSVINATRKKLIAQLEDYGSVSKPTAADENMAPVKLSDVQRALFTTHAPVSQPKRDFIGIAGLLVTAATEKGNRAQQQGFAPLQNGGSKLSSSLPSALSHMAQTPQSNRVVCNNSMLGNPKISVPAATDGIHAPLFHPHNIHSGFAIATQAPEARLVSNSAAVGAGVSSPFAANHSQSSPRHVFHSPSNNFTAGPGAKTSKLKSSSPSKKLRIAVAEVGAGQTGGSPIPSAPGYAVTGRVRSYENLGDALHATPSSPAGRSQPATSDDEGMDGGCYSAAHPTAQPAGVHTSTSVWRGVAGYLGFGQGRGQGQSLLAAFKGAVNNTTTATQPIANKPQQTQGNSRILNGSSPAKTSMKSPRTLLGRMMSPSASSKHRVPREPPRVDVRPATLPTQHTEPLAQQAAGTSSKQLQNNTSSSRSEECLKSIAVAAEQRLPIEKARSNLSMQLQSRPSSTSAAILSLACTSMQSAAAPAHPVPPPLTGHMTEPQPSALSCTPFESLQHEDNAFTTQQFMLSKPADVPCSDCNKNPRLNTVPGLPMQHSHNVSSHGASDDVKVMEPPASAESLSQSAKHSMERDSAQQLAAEFMSDELIKSRSGGIYRMSGGGDATVKQQHYTDMELGTVEDIGFALGTCEMYDPDGQP